MRYRILTRQLETESDTQYLERLESQLFDCATLLAYAISPRESLNRGQAISAIRECERLLGWKVERP